MPSQSFINVSPDQKGINTASAPSAASWGSEDHSQWVPDITVSGKELFGIKEPAFSIPAFSTRTELVPEIDDDYVFDQASTVAVLAGFAFNRRVLLQGYHGTGKSTHIEQVAARLNWPCLRINLDSTISRLDLIGKDAISIRDGKQITEFVPGILPWSFLRPVALCFDEYDAGRPDVMFVIQRVLEAGGRLTLLDQSIVLKPHPGFRLFATANTIGLGDSVGMYHGTQALNQGQMDRWHIVSVLNYMPMNQEKAIILKKCAALDTADGRQTLDAMIRMANFTRSSLSRGDLSTVMSPRTVLSWAENSLIFDDVHMAFKVSFLYRCDEAERPLINEEYQRCFAVDLLATPQTKKAKLHADTEQAS